MRSPITILAASSQPNGGWLDISLCLPASELKDFEAYMERTNAMKISPWDRPLAMSVSIGTPTPGEWGWDQPFNRPRIHGIASDKGLLARIRRHLKKGPLSSVSFEIHKILWERIVERAAHYDITPGEHCLKCIGYHAALERRYQTQEKPRSPFETFERTLAKEARLTRTSKDKCSKPETTIQ